MEENIHIKRLNIKRTCTCFFSVSRPDKSVLLNRSRFEKIRNAHKYSPPLFECCELKRKIDNEVYLTCSWNGPIFRFAHSNKENHIKCHAKSFINCKKKIELWTNSKTTQNIHIIQLNFTNRMFSTLSIVRTFDFKFTHSTHGHIRRDRYNLFWACVTPENNQCIQILLNTCDILFISGWTFF